MESEAKGWARGARSSGIKRWCPDYSGRGNGVAKAGWRNRQPNGKNALKVRANGAAEILLRENRRDATTRAGEDKEKRVFDRGGFAVDRKSHRNKCTDLDSILGPNMATKKFHHHFTPFTASTPNPISFRVNDIAKSAVMEMGQLASASVSLGSFIAEITKDTNDFFVWSRRLGTVRETKTALSGLFGRFVARAYLERYAGVKYFWPITTANMSIPGTRKIKIRRTPKTTGDLPDWVCATGTGQYLIAEAKGSHNSAGYDAALSAAKKQVKRVQIVSGKKPVVLRVKQYSIATRWAVKGSLKLDEPWLAVHDPDEGERDATLEERTELSKRVSVMHFASLLNGMGYGSVSDRISENNYPILGDPEFELQVDGIPGHEPLVGYVAVVSMAGIIHLPPADILAVPAMARRIRGLNALLLVVPSRSSDGQSLEIKAAPQESLLSTDVETPLWDMTSQNPDGTWLVPARNVRLKRVTASSQTIG